MNATIIEAALALRTAHDTGVPCAPVRARLPKGDVDAAYAVQDENTRYWLAQKRRLVGRKIGLTAKAVQRQLGVDQPDFGMLFADMAMNDGEEIAVRARPAAEGRGRDRVHPRARRHLRAAHRAPT